MSDPRRPSLFDLPLDPPDSAEVSTNDPEEAPESALNPPERPPATAAPPGPRRATGDPLPLFPDPEGEAESPRRTAERPKAARPTAQSAPSPGAAELESRPPDPPRRTAEPRPATLGVRIQAGLLDLLVHLGLALAALAVGWMVGVPWRPRELMGLGLFLLVFSFLYTVIPLAFWGFTPGMGRVGVVARSRETGALTFGQTAQRWLGAVVTVLLAGLPALLALTGGGSLADRLSDSLLWLDPS